LSASGVDAALRGASTKGLEADGSLPQGSFLGLSEMFMNEVARRAVSDTSRSRRNPIGNFRKLRASDAVYALVPGLRKLASKEHIYFELAFPNPPRFEFSKLDGAGAGWSGSDARIRVHFSDVEIHIRTDEGGQKKRLGTLHVESGRMAVVPFASRLGGISFHLLENQWQVSSTGLEFDESLAAATLQELTFGKIFATTYEPLLRRAMHLGETEFLPQSFAVNGGYLVIGLDAPKPFEGRASAEASTRTDTPLGSR
jgi:hypothetical protein